MIFSLLLQASANRVVFEYTSMVRRNACCAPSVMLSASSKMTILCRPFGSVTFCWANILILLRTTSMPRSFEAFNSRTASLKLLPNKMRAKHRIVVVFPTPGGPYMGYSTMKILMRNYFQLRFFTAIMTFGAFPWVANTARRPTISSLPTISSNFCGRYFSTLKPFKGYVSAILITRFCGFISYQGIFFRFAISAT